MEKIIIIERSRRTSSGNTTMAQNNNKLILKEMENIIDLHPGLIVGFAVIFIMLLLILGILIKKPTR
jgi:hypothetical protein